MSKESQIPHWNEIQTPNEFMSFLVANFEHTGVRYYLDAVENNLRDFAYRQENPLYLPYVSRILLIPAEHQMPGVVGHLSNHKLNNWPCDFMAPRYLLALGVYLAKSALVIAEKKAEIVRKWDTWLSAEDTAIFLPHLLEAWVKPYALETFPTAVQFVNDAKISSFGGRKDKLPVYIPDTKFLQSVAHIPFTGKRAVEMQRAEFVETILPDIKSIFFPYEEQSMVDSLFLEDSSWHQS